METPPSKLASGRSRGGGARDFISDLPDDLIASILAFLPAEDAVKTSALSRRWRALWPAPHLDLCALAPEAVDRVLRRHEGTLLGCRIALSEPTESCLPHFLRWVALLAQKRIQTLDIRGHRSPMASTFPPGAFAAAGASLRHLALSGFDVATPPELLLECPHLTSLQLSTISSMKDDTLSQVLARCPRLEALSLSHCTDLVHPTISSPALRHLVLARLPQLRSVVIDTPALVTLSTFMSDGSTECRHGAAAAFHEPAELKACRCSMDVLECFTNIKNLPNFDINLSPFVCLRRLAVHINLNDLRQVVVMRFMFLSCHQLKEVRIKNGAATISGENQHCLVPYLETEVWRRPEYNACLKNFCENLRELSLVGYTGTQLEWEFLAFLTSNSAAIRRLSIWWCCGQCRPSDRAAARATLSAMKRASKDLVITFQGQRVDPVLQQLQTEL
uniref:Putative F-box/LRR-repeat protein At5g02700 n=1 Tax=Anthurium amnicola TaxID=1678845 RepID=A0A1D1XVR3_9ARAE